MLGAVLDALTEPGAGDPAPSFWCATGLPTTTIDRGNVIVVGSPYLTVRYPWTTDPAEAYEILQTRGLIPLEYVGRFACDACGGSGLVQREGWRGIVPCEPCGTRGHLPHPPTVAALASWASVGFAAHDDGTPGILGAEELAGELNNGAEVRWQVAPPASVAPPGVTWPPAIEALWRGGFDVLRGHTRTTLYVAPL